MNELSDEQEAALDEAREAAAQEGTVTRLRPDVVPQAALAVQPSQSDWTETQVAALAAIGLADVPDGDRRAYLHLCQRSGLDPFAKEIYLIGRKDQNAPSGIKYTAQTGIDGYRHIAQRTGEFEGREGPWWCGRDGQWKDVWLDADPPSAAKVRIFRRGKATFEAIALFREFAPYYWDNRSREQKLSAMWTKMPAHMIAKCAEALAIRQAFPREASGIYLTEEMHQADAAEKETARLRVEQERARQRRELNRFSPDPGDPASPADTAPGEVVEGEVVEAVNRDALWAEVETQAEILGQSVASMSSRWVAANRKNLDQADVPELMSFIEANRHRVDAKMQENAAKFAEMSADVAAQTVIPVDTDDEVPNEPTEQPIANPDIDPKQPHPYQDWSGKCIVCMKAQSNKLHDTSAEGD